MKIVTKEEAIQRLNNKFPETKFDLLEFSGITKPTIIRCLNCGKEIKNSMFSNVFHRKTLCDCLNPNSSSYKHKQNKQKILQLCEENNNIEWISFGYRENVKKYSVQIKCLTCNSIFDKDWESFLNNQTCPHCSQSNHNLNSAGFQLRLPKEYTLISEYKNNETKVLIRHNCGFIWKIRPHTFLNKIKDGYIGCPHCNHKKSQGELKICQFLTEKKINFYNEYIFNWSSNPKYRYDFYLPDYNLVIEYMGAQHYKEVNFFHDTLEERQLHDKIKKNEALQNGLYYLEICYLDFSNIEIIIQNWFNDYSERK